MYIGRENIYGLFEKQVLTILDDVYTYQLLWQAGSASSLMVITDGTILEPGVDYSLGIDGYQIVFNDVPQHSSGERTYIIYLGRELSVPRTVNIEPLLVKLIGDGTTNTFSLGSDPIISSAAIVFIDGIQKREGDDFIIAGTNIEFTMTPTDQSLIDVYIHGVERFDSVLIPDRSIIGEKLVIGAVTGNEIQNYSIPYNKLILNWTNWLPVFETFSGMTITSQTINKAQFIRLAEGIVKIKMDFSIMFGGTPQSFIRYSLPVNPAIDELVNGSVELSIDDDNILDSGINRWGGEGFCDIYRTNGLNYTINKMWRFKLRAEYDLGI